MALRERRDSSDLWRAGTDALFQGLRRSLDYQRELGDDYRERFLEGREPGDRTAAPDWQEAGADVVDYGSSVLRLTFDYYRDLADAATRFAEESASWYAPQSPVTTDFGPGGRHPQRMSAQIRGVLGSEARTRIRLENSDAQPAEVMLEVGICHGPGGESFEVDVAVTPDAVVIEPDSSATVTAVLHLDPERFSAGHTYRVPVTVHGPQPAIVDLDIVVDDATREGVEREDETEAEHEDAVPERRILAEREASVARAEEDLERREDHLRQREASLEEAERELRRRMGGLEEQDGERGRSGASRIADETTNEPAPAASAVTERTPAGFRVRCPACGRVFERTTESVRLRPHNDPDGSPCPERAGARAH